MKVILFLSCFFSSLYFGQNKIFLYEHKFISDSTHRENIESEIMVLNVNKNKSEFYSLDKYQSDSTLIADSKKGIMSMPPNRRMTDERVIKHVGSDNINYFKILGNTKYDIIQNINLKWNIVLKFDKILGFNVQEATTEYGGRKWIAWFSKEIPIQDGPYKFFQLPGLILKIEDIDRNHIFELEGIENVNTEFVYPELNNFRTVKVTYPRFTKLFKNYRKSPLADLMGKIPDQTDSKGVFKKGIEIFRQEEKKALENISKDNNIIEINLLRK